MGIKKATTMTGEMDYFTNAARCTTKSLWNGATSHILVIDCSDPRLTDGRREFLADLYDAHRYDSILVPGGPGAAVSPSPSHFVERERISMLYQLHKFGKIVAIAHDDCGCYKHMYPGTSAEERRNLQIADLGKFVNDMRGFVPSVKVETYYAEPDENGFTQFTRIS